MMALCVTALFGTAGLAIDLGRMYIAKNEAQSFADFSAMTAVRELDGTNEGLDRARSVVASSEMKWGFQTTNYSDTIIEFSSDSVSWDPNPGSSADQRYVRVTAQILSIPMYFIRMAGGDTGTVRARAAAGQESVTSFPPGSVGTLPFAPLAHNPAQTPYNGGCTAGGSCFGFNPGDIITLRWPANKNVGVGPNMCPADNAEEWINLATENGKTSDRGYIQETSANAIREAIEDDRVNYSVTLGQPVNMTGGSKQSQSSSLENRAMQDTDTTSTTYAQYLANGEGNGRRVGVVPIVSAQSNFRVVGFATIFLPVSQPSNPNQSFCAEYVDFTYLQGSTTGGGAGPGGVYTMRLVE